MSDIVKDALKEKLEADLNKDIAELGDIFNYEDSINAYIVELDKILKSKDKKPNLKELIEAREYLIKFQYVLNKTGKRDTRLKDYENIFNSKIEEYFNNLNEQLNKETFEESDIVIPTEEEIKKIDEMDKLSWGKEAKHEDGSYVSFTEKLTFFLFYINVISINKINDKDIKEEKLKELINAFYTAIGDKDVLKNNLIYIVKSNATDGRIIGISIDSENFKKAMEEQVNNRLSLVFNLQSNALAAKNNFIFNLKNKEQSIFNDNFITNLIEETLNSPDERIKKLEGKLYSKENFTENCISFENFKSNIPAPDFNYESLLKESEASKYLGTFIYNELLKIINKSDSDLNHEDKEKLKKAIYYMLYAKDFFINKQEYSKSTEYGEKVKNFKELLTNILVKISGEDYNKVNEEIGVKLSIFAGIKKNDYIDLEKYHASTDDTKETYNVVENILNNNFEINNVKTRLIIDKKKSNHFCLLVNYENKDYIFNSEENGTWTQELCYFFAIEEDYTISEFLLQSIPEEKIGVFLEDIQKEKFNGEDRKFYENNEQKIRNCIAVMQLNDKNTQEFKKAKEALISIIKQTPFHQRVQKIYEKNYKKKQQEQISKPEEPKQNKSKQEELKEKTELLKKEEDEFIQKCENFFSPDVKTYAEERVKIVGEVDEKIKQENPENKIKEFERAKMVASAISNHILKESNNDLVKAFNLMVNFKTKGRTSYIIVRKIVTDSENMKININSETSIEHDIIFPTLNIINYLLKCDYQRTASLLINNLIDKIIPNMLTQGITEDQKEKINIFLEKLREIKQKNNYQEISAEERKQKMENCEYLKYLQERKQKKLDSRQSDIEKIASENKEQSDTLRIFLKTCPLYLGLLDEKSEKCKEIKENLDIVISSQPKDLKESQGTFVKKILDNKQKQKSAAQAIL